MHMESGRLMEHCEVEVEAGTNCLLHRMVSVFTSRDGENPFQRSMEHLRDVVTKGAESAVWAHVSAWESRWKTTDIKIEGDDSLQQALRFAA
jgi:trehalose/maltose hydrolase-like predicted phosphorylase